ncbi:MAG: nitrile hydratase accessory protein [Pseudomonadota bacterium]
MTGQERQTDLGPAAGGDAPVFAEPWEAQAFAMVVHLHDRGAFTWQEWAACLSDEIHGDVERSYYAHWLRALEKIVAVKGLAAPDALTARKRAWQEAAARTPHGHPIALDDPPEA